MNGISALVFEEKRKLLAANHSMINDAFTRAMTESGGEIGPPSEIELNLALESSEQNDVYDEQGNSRTDMNFRQPSKHNAPFL